MILTTIFYALLALFIYIVLYRAIILVNQSDVAVIERLGKYSRTCEAGLHVIVPFLDRPLSRNGKKRISILEQQIDVGFISVITKDNVEVDLETVVFFKTVDAAKSVYRIADVRQGMINAATSIVRSAGGKLELDEFI